MIANTVQKSLIPLRDIPVIRKNINNELLEIGKILTSLKGNPIPRGKARLGSAQFVILNFFRNKVMQVIKRSTSREQTTLRRSGNVKYAEFFFPAVKGMLVIRRNIKTKETSRQRF